MTARRRLAVALVVGAVAGAASLLRLPPDVAVLVGWDTATLCYLAWLWPSVWWLDAEGTARHASREDPSRAVTDLLLLCASVASLLAVGMVLMRAGDSAGAAKVWLASLAVVSVLLSWASVHTTYVLRYARLYYSGPEGGIDFKQRPPPRMRDFAYVGFTVGMTFQVSDTDVRDPDIRATVLRHALLSYLFGTVIIAVTINLVAGLG
jgi:uncharacterized membrane protein